MRMAVKKSGNSLFWSFDDGDTEKVVKVSDRMFTFVHTLFSQKSTNFAADAARTTCTVKNNFFGVPKNKTICAKKKHLDFYNIKNCAGGSSLYLLCTCYSISLNLKNHRFVWFFVEKNTPTLMAFTGANNALGPSPQPTGFRSPT